MSEKLNSSVKNLLEEVEKITTPEGFSRRRFEYRLNRGDGVGIIEVQISRDPILSGVKLTLNLAILCSVIVDPTDDIGTYGVTEAHLRQRIGFVMPANEDVWWTMDGANEDVCIREILEAVDQYAIPYILRYLDAKNLLELWEAGKSPGLTQKQRLQYLQVLQESR